MNGVVFDIKEFAVYDGPGIRTTVFMKGCPLRCRWCHNPEGLSMRPQLMVSMAACRHCGACERVCAHAPDCVACGACVPVCSAGLRRIAGTIWSDEALAERLMRDEAILRLNGGGVTFSGGEPLMQWQFVRTVIDRMNGMHTCIETSGYAPDDVFDEAISRLSMVMMDIKLIDTHAHQQWTNVDNTCILRHAETLCRGDTPFIIRLPLIPGVNDNTAHYRAVASLLRGARALVRVELLPYHQTAGAKYAMASMPYTPGFDTTQTLRIDGSAFDEAGIRWLAL